MDENAVLLGVDYDMPRCRWANTTASETIDLSDVQGRIFALTDGIFYPYEYQKGPVPDLSCVHSAVLSELGSYLHENKLASIFGLQVIEHPTPEEGMMKLILPKATVMLRASDLFICHLTR